MADQQKGKNRAAILQELESIKGLLVDEEDIPVLQEVIDSAEAQLDDGETLDDEDLQELQQAYRDLLQASEDSEGSDAPAVTTSRVEQTAVKTAVKTEVQTSLFDLDEPSTEDDTDALTENSQPDTTAERPVTPKQSEPESRDLAPRRPGVIKATGENPFLPAHIRARLHGNRPPPLFEPLTHQPKPRSETSKSSGPGYRVKRAQIADELVAEFLPQIEAALRQRLRSLSEEQLQQLASESDHRQNDGDGND